MSHFGDLIGTTSPKTEPTVVVEPNPVEEEKPLDISAANAADGPGMQIASN